MPEKCKFCGKERPEGEIDWAERFGWLICPECWAAHKAIMWANDLDDLEVVLHVAA